MFSEKDHPKYNRIIAVSIGGLGDTILFSPLLKALHRSYPDAHIELLVANRLAQEAYSSAKEISHVSFINFGRLPFALRAICFLPMALNSCLKGEFDIGFFATGLNPKLGQLMKKVGIIRDIAYAPSFPSFPTDLDCNLQLAKSINSSIAESDTFIPITKKAELEAVNVLKEHNLSITNKRLLAVYPSIELAHRPRWKLQKLIKVIKLIRQTGFNGKIIVVGSKIEGEEWVEADKEKTVDAIFAGKLSIQGTAAVLKKCDFTIGNDGGLMHVAGSVGCPLVVIMANTPLNYKPPGRKVIVINSELSCCDGLYPKRPVKCKIARCTENISIKRVFLSCQSFLQLSN